MTTNAARLSEDGPERLAVEFLTRVWGAHDLDAIEELMTPDYVITSAGREIRGRDAFKSWVHEFHRLLLDARTESIEVFSDAAGDRVVSRWVCSGRNNGIFGLVPDARPISFTGIAIWAVRDGRLAECWVERSALEVLNSSAPSASLAGLAGPPRSASHLSGRGTSGAHLQRLFAHMFWADGQVLDLLDRSAMARQAEPVRLLSHLLAAERVWLLRIRGEDSAVQPIWPELTLVELSAMRVANAAGYTRYLQALTPGDLEREIEYVNSRGTPFRTPVSDVLTHVALHGSYHRGQLARAVRGAGEEPVNTDYITYVRDLEHVLYSLPDG